MKTLARLTMRLRPDRIVIGEVRGGEALDLFKAWKTEHPGGLATVPANSAIGALHRIEQLIEETIAVAPRRIIAEAVDLIVFNAVPGIERRVDAIEAVTGLTFYGDHQLANLKTYSEEPIDDLA